MSRRGGANDAICGFTDTSARRYFDRIGEICKKYENDGRVNVQVVDIRNFNTVSNDEEIDEETDPNESRDFSESDEDYVESSYNDGRCSSSLASSNSIAGYMKSPKGDRSLSIFPRAGEFKRSEDKFSATKGRRNTEEKGNIIKLENTDIFIDILRTAQLQKDQFMSDYFGTESDDELESSDDELVGAKGRENVKRRKCDEKSDKIVPNKPIKSGKEAGQDKESRRIPLKDDLDGEPNLDICFLEEPDLDALREEGIFTIDKSLDRTRIRNYASSLSSCSFETDSLDSPLNRVSKFRSSKEKNSVFKPKKYKF